MPQRICNISYNNKDVQCDRDYLPRCNFTSGLPTNGMPDHILLNLLPGRQYVNFINKESLKG